MASKEFEMFVEQADRLASQGRLEEAVDMYQRALSIEPNDAIVRHNVINIYIKSGEFEPAVSEYLQWAKVCQENGLIDDAIAVYDELNDLENQVSKKSFMMGQRSAVGDIIKELVGRVRPDVYYNVGVLLQAKGLIDSSIVYLKACLELSLPDSTARVHMVLGQAYMKKGMDREAIGEFQEVVRLAPMDAAYAYEMLGEIYIRGGRTPNSTINWFKSASELYLKNNQILDAIRVFERILNFDARNKDVLTALSEIYSQRGQIDKSVDVCVKLAGIYEDEGLLDKVEEMYEQITEWVPDNLDFRQKLIEIYRKILNADPSDLVARHKLIGILLNNGVTEEAIPEFLLLAKTYLSKGMFQEGISVCEKMLDIDPYNLEANETLGEIYFNEGDSDRALDQFLHVVKLLRERGDTEAADKLNKDLVKRFPQQIEIYYRQAIEEKEKGNYSSALSILDSLIKDNPQYKQAMFARADIFVKQDKWNDAFAQYNEILAIDPNYIEVRKILLEKYLADGDLEKALVESNEMASRLFNKGDYRETESLYRKMLTYLPDDPEIREKICEVQSARGHLEKAMSGYLIIYEIYYRKNDIPHAIDMCEKILELSSDNIFAKRKLADLYKSSDQKKAVELYSEIANFYISKKLEKPAADIFGDILEISPEENSIRKKLIDIYIKQVKYDEATKNYRYLLIDYLKNKDYPKARETVKDIIALQPFDLKIKEELGATYIDNDLLSEAMEIFEELVHGYTEKGDLEKVIELNLKLEELASKRNNTYLAWDYSIKAAELYYKNEKYDEASEKYLATLKQMINYDEYEREEVVFNSLINIYNVRGNIDEGIAKLDAMAHEFIDSGDIEKSLVLLEQIEKVYENNKDFEKALEVLDFLSSHYEELGNRSESIRVRQSMIDIYFNLDKNTGSKHDDIIENYFDMIDLSLKSDMPSEACSYYDEIEKIRPNDEASILKMAQMLFSANFMNESLPFFKKLLAINPNSNEAMSHLAIIYANNSNYDEAIIYATKILTIGNISSVIKEYRKMVFENSSTGEAHMNLGKFYEALGFPEEAVLEYNKAVETDKKNEAQNQIGMIFLKQKFYNLAICQFQNILAEGIDDEDKEQATRYNLAEAFYCQGLYEDALAMYEECYAVDIDYRDVGEKIAKLGEMIEM